MIRIVVLYFAIGMLLVTRYSWDEMVRYFEKDNIPKPLMILVFIWSCFVGPVYVVIGLIQEIIKQSRNN